MSRGVIYVIWGDAHVSGELAYRSLASAKGCGLHTTLLTDQTTNVEPGTFDDVVRIDFPSDLKNLSRKSLMYDYSPYDETLFLDDDTVILDQDLSFAWEMVEAHGLAVAYAPTFHLWANGKEIDRNMIYYNSGVVFFKKDDRVKKLFDRWKVICAETGASNDQPPFCAAIYRERFNPFCLPHTWNFRGQFGKTLWIHGPLKIWHSRREVPEYHEYWNSKRLPGFAKAMGNGKGRLGLFWRRLYICGECGRVKRSASDLQPPRCKDCCTDEREVFMHPTTLEQEERALEFDKDDEGRLRWWRKSHSVLLA